MTSRITTFLQQFTKSQKRPAKRGYRPREGDSPYSVLLAAPEGGRDLALRLRPEGRVFGGN